MSLNDEEFKSLFVSFETLQEIIRYKHEVLLDINETFIHSENEIIKSYLSFVNSSEINYYLEYHQKILINFLYFRDENILLNFIEWIYNVFYHKGINLDVFCLSFKLWKDSYHKYLDSINILEVENIYSFLIKNHKNFKEKALLRKLVLPNNPLIDEIYNLCINAKKQEVLELCKKNCKNIEMFIEFFSNVLSNVLQKVGFMWELSHVSVAKEHISSTIIEEVCLELIDTFPKEVEDDKTILLSNAPNEFHGMGLKILAKILEKKSYNVINLGSSGTPSNDILNAIEEFEPDFIIFGISISVNLYDVSLIIKNLLSKSYNKKYKTIVGGSAFKGLKNPKKSLNADYYSNSLDEVFSILKRYHS